MPYLENLMQAAKKYDLDKIQNLIETGFLHDWAISIEYAVKTQQEHVRWERWDKSLFAIKDSEAVVEKIMECCKNNPECSMKLICEHFNPHYRMVYCIHRKDREPLQLQS